MSVSQPRPQLLDQAQLTALVQSILAEARAQGADAAEAGLSVETGLQATVRLGDVETIEHQRDKGLGITVYFGTRKGSASSSDFNLPALRETVRAACAIARHTAHDPCAGLADPDRMPGTVPDLDLYHPWDLSVEQAVETARECESAARTLDPRIANSEGATLSSHHGARAYGNSHGFVAAYSVSRHSLSCAVIAQDAHSMERDYWYTVARDPTELEPAVSVGRRAAQRALRRLNGRRVRTREVPVLFDASVAGSLLGHFVSAIRGASLYRRASFLVDHLGRLVFPAHVRIHEQPHLPKGLGSAPFDGEGVATEARDLIRAGILQGYVLDSYSARKLGMETTGNAGGVHNLIIEPGTQDLDGLLKTLGTGLLVTEMMGMGVNIVTGDYSRGAAGFWVEDGAIVHPVHEITVAANLRDMFMGMVEVGRDVELRGNIRTGSILIEHMTVAGE